MKKIIGCLLLVAGPTLTACHSSSAPAPSPPQQPAPPAVITDVQPGAWLVNGAGVAIGAPTGSIAAAITPTIENTARPASPLPYGTAAVGDAYRIGATQPVEAAPDSVLLIGLPIPAGEDPALLAVAVHVPEGAMLDGPGSDLWILLDTVASGASGMAFVGVPRLDPDGLVYLLVRDPTAAGPASVASLKSSSTQSRSTVQSKWTQVPNPLVEASCSPEFTDPIVTATCGPNELQLVQDVFQALFLELIGAGYPLPRLARRVLIDDRVLSTQQFAALGLPEVAFGPFVVKLRPQEVLEIMSDPTLGRSRGVYAPASESLEIGIPSGGIGDTVIATLRHETFHAFQHGFDATNTNYGPPRSWFVESQATVAEQSDSIALLRDPERLWRDATEALTRGKDTEPAPLPYRIQMLAYDAQDFWIYLAKRASRGLDFFVPFLRQGYLPEQVNAAFAGGAAGPDLASFTDAYFSWAKNQTFEAAVELPTGYIPGTPAPELFGGACAPQYTTNPSDGSDLYLGGSLAGGTLDYDPDAQPYWVDPTLGMEYVNGRLVVRYPNWGRRLEALLIPYELAAARDYTVRISVTPNDDDVRYKVYDLDSPDCATEPDNEPRIFDVKAGDPLTAYVLLVWGNRSTSSVTSAEVVIEPIALHLDPPFGDHALLQTETLTQTFTIINDTNQPINFQAVAGDSWLSLDASTDAGVVPGGGSFDVVYRVTCAIPDGSAETDVLLQFTDANGAVIAGSQVPAVYHVGQHCGAPVDQCIDYWGQYRGYSATATLSWGSARTKVTGDTTAFASVQHSATVSTTYDLLTPSIISSGSASVSDERTISFADGSYVTQKWSSGGGPALGNATSDSPAAIGASYSDFDCRWSVGVTVFVDGTLEEFSSENPDGTSQDGRFSVGFADVASVPATGSVIIPFGCQGDPNCTAGIAGIGNANMVLGLMDDPSQASGVVFSWSVSPIPR